MLEKNGQIRGVGRIWSLTGHLSSGAGKETRCILVFFGCSERFTQTWLKTNLLSCSSGGEKSERGLTEPSPRCWQDCAPPGGLQRGVRFPAFSSR